MRSIHSPKTINEEKKKSKQQRQPSGIDIQVCDDDDNKSEDVFSDSTDDEMSMARMREEYYKSQTIAKKFTDLFEDVRDLLNGGKVAMEKKFKKKKPMIVRPMMMSIDDDKAKVNAASSEDHTVESESDEKVKEDDEI